MSAAEKEAAESARVAAAMRAKAAETKVNMGSAMPIKVMTLVLFAATGVVAFNLYQKGRLPYVSPGHTLSELREGSFKPGSDYQYNNRAKK